MDQHERLQSARAKAGFENATDAARAYGWNENTYRSHENGERGLRQDVASRYAKAFKVSSGWLLTGEGNGTATNIVSVRGKVAAGGRIDTSSEQFADAEPLFDIYVDVPVPIGAIALQVEGESMWPRYDPGDVVICHKESQDPSTLLGWEAVVQTYDGSRYLKRLLRGGAPGTYTLESHNAPPMRDESLLWASEVRHVVRASRWRKLDDKGRRRELSKVVT